MLMVWARRPVPNKPANRTMKITDKPLKSNETAQNLCAVRISRISTGTDYDPLAKSATHTQNLGDATWAARTGFFSAPSGCPRRTRRLPLAIFSVCRAPHSRQAFRVRFARARFRDASAIPGRLYKVRRWLARPRVAPPLGSPVPCFAAAASRDHATSARIAICIVTARWRLRGEPADRGAAGLRRGRRGSARRFCLQCESRRSGCRARRRRVRASWCRARRAARRLHLSVRLTGRLTRRLAARLPSRSRSSLWPRDVARGCFPALSRHYTRDDSAHSKPPLARHPPQQNRRPTSAGPSFRATEFRSRRAAG